VGVPEEINSDPDHLFMKGTNLFGRPGHFDCRDVRKNGPKYALPEVLNQADRPR